MYILHFAGWNFSAMFCIISLQEKKQEVIKVKDILKNPAAAAVLDKFCEGASKNPQMKLVGGLTLRKLASFPQSAYLQPHLEELDKELQAIE